jgi:probable HAF family extracellular repeat protein
MFRNRKWTGRRIAIAVAIGLVCSSQALAKKPPTPPPPDDPAPYTLIDLLGFPDNGYQSQGEFITNRDGNGAILIGGNSRLYPDPEGPAVFHPALWHVDINGDFPDTDPVDLGIPPFAGEAEPRGLNGFGVMVADTRRAIEKDDDGNWVFPAYVDHPFFGFLELPAPVNRHTEVWGINDSGVIIGAFQDYSDPEDPGSLIAFSGIWQLNLNGTISGPISLGTFYPRHINNFGVMAGRCPGWPAIAWFDEDGTLLIERLDSSPQFFGADVNALNDYPITDARLTVVGKYGRDENGESAPGRGYAWRPRDADNPTTLLETLGGVGSSAQGVNRSGEIVGWSDTKKHGQQAFIFKDGTMSNLNSMADVGNATLKFALDINDDGDIVGFMGIPRPISEQRGFLLRPIQQ